MMVQVLRPRDFNNYDERQHFKKSCFGKQNHRDPINALVACHFIYRVFSDSLFPYKCKFCVNWHIGHQPRNIRMFICSLLGIPYVPRRERVKGGSAPLEQLWRNNEA